MIAAILGMAGPLAYGQEEAPPPAPSAEPAPAPPEKPPSEPKILWLDFKHLVSSPFRWETKDWLIFSATAAAVGGSMVVDDEVSDAARKDGPTLGTWGETIEGLGDPRVMVVIGGFYLTGLIGHDTKAKQVAFDALFASIVGAGIINAGIATVVGRERPSKEEGPYAFHPFKGRSFPSGHVAEIFAVVSVISAHYEQFWVRALAYTAGTIGAYERLRRGKHYLSDIIAGGVIGTASGYSIVKFNKRLRSGEKEPPPSDGVTLSIVPLVQHGSYGAFATLRF